MSPSKEGKAKEGGKKAKEKTAAADGPRGGATGLKCAKGMQDFGPRSMAVRARVFDLITGVFRRHGAVTIDTPVCELRSLLLGQYGEEGGKLVYNLEDQGGEILSLRYDLTVPFARYLAQNRIRSLTRYHIAKVYRRDQPAMSKGRFREFYQCDFDIAGVCEPLLAEAKCLRIVDEVLSALDLGTYVIKVNHRRLLDAMFQAAGVPAAQFKSICSSVDKLDKASWAEVYAEMVTEKGLASDAADRLEPWLVGDASGRSLAALKAEPALAALADAREALAELERLFHFAQLFRIRSVVFEPSLARGLDYYTGVIYEAVVEAPKGGAGVNGGEEESRVGSIAGGGRYDKLVESFVRGHSVPCCGVSLGIERILALMEARATAEGLRTTATQVYIAAAHKGLLEERMRLAATCWEAGLAAEMGEKANPKLLDQLQYCEDHAIPLAAILGGDELARGKVKLRRIATREEAEVDLDSFVQEVRQRLQD